jgi:hypothetical protein
VVLVLAVMDSQVIVLVIVENVAKVWIHRESLLNTERKLNLLELTQLTIKKYLIKIKKSDYKVALFFD